jgi:hypothetical protein
MQDPSTERNINKPPEMRMSEWLRNVCYAMRLSPARTWPEGKLSRCCSAKNNRKCMLEVQAVKYYLVECSRWILLIKSYQWVN